MLLKGCVCVCVAKKHLCCKTRGWPIGAPRCYPKQQGWCFTHRAFTSRSLEARGWWWSSEWHAAFLLARVRSVMCALSAVCLSTSTSMCLYICLCEAGLINQQDNEFRCRATLSWARVRRGGAAVRPGKRSGHISLRFLLLSRHSVEDMAFTWHTSWQASPSITRYTLHTVEFVLLRWSTESPASILC